MSVLVPILHCLHYCSFLVSFKVKMCSPLTFFLFRIILAILGPLHFHMNFRISLTISSKEANWDFDRHYIELVGQFGKYFHLNNIVFQPRNMGCLLIYLDLQFFSTKLCSFQWKSLALLFKKFILNYFTVLMLL